MTPESKEQLEAFVQRAERVARSAYVQRVRQQGRITVRIDWDESSTNFAHNFPGEEEIDALVLTARMFIQNNDPVSFGNMAKLDTDPGISVEWKVRFRDARRRLNEYLDAKTWFNQPGEHYSHEQVFRTFIYGGLAHTDPKHAPLYRRWASNALTSLVYGNVFHAVLSHLANVTSYIADFTRDELAGRAIPPLEAVPGTSEASPVVT